MRWLPTLRIRFLDQDEARELGLATRWRWRVLEFTWLDFGLIISAWAEAV